MRRRRDPAERPVDVGALIAQLSVIRETLLRALAKFPTNDRARDALQLTLHDAERRFEVWAKATKTEASIAPWCATPCVGEAPCTLRSRARLLARYARELAPLERIPGVSELRAALNGTAVELRGKRE